MIKFFQHTAVEPRDKELFNKFYEAVSQKADDVRITQSGIYQSCSVAVIWGSWKKLSKKEWKFLRAPHHRLKDDIVKKHGQRPLVIIETPILGRTIGKYHKYYRVGLNHYLNNLGEFNNKDCKSDRFDSLNLKIKPWRSNGKHILVLGQNLNDASLLGADMELWTITTLKHLLKVTDRKIHFRDHPENGSKLKDVLEKNFYGIKQIVYDTSNNINEALENAHCAVAYTSGSSIDAILEGVPVIPTSQYNFVWEISSHSLNDIENPKLGEREQLLYNLAYAQWSVSEIKEGKPWDHLNELINGYNI